MGSIDSLTNPLVDHAIARSLVPLQPSVEVGNSNEQTSANKPSPPPPVSRDMLEGLQIRAELLQQKHPMAEQNSTRGRHAIGAYGALKNSEERDRISSLLGVDEYA